jgi:hypothetical protein
MVTVPIKDGQAFGVDLRPREHHAPLRVEVGREGFGFEK